MRASIGPLDGVRTTAAPSRPLARRSRPFFYLFSHAPIGPSGTYPHLAHHASEIPFTFHVAHSAGPDPDLWTLHGAAETNLSAAMVAHWRANAADGEPGTGGGVAPHWPQWRAGSDERAMEYADAPRLRSGLKAAACDFWEEVYAASASHTRDALAAASGSA